MIKCAVKIMSWNIRHGRGMDGRVELRAIIEEIKAVNPDVVALQEVDRFRKRSGGGDQIRLLAENLGMFWCFAASICDGFSEYGNAIASKHPIADSRVLAMPGGRERRTLLEAEIVVGAGHYEWRSRGAEQGPQLTVLTTHLGVDEDDRRMQAPLLLRRLAGAPKPAVLAGDFNVAPEHALPLELQRTGWRRLCQREPARPTYADRAEIDLMFMSGWDGGESPELRVLDSSASDHCPIVADIPLGVIK